MKKLSLIFSIILNSLLVLGQQVNSPEPKSFSINTAGQDASGFYLSGFNSSDILLCAIGIPQAPSGTSFYITSTSGVTPSIGYSLSGNKTRLTFTGTQSSINNALSSLKINTTGTSGNIQISVSATINPSGYYYLPSNGHFYRPMSWPSGSSYQGTSATVYNNLKSLCASQTFKGQRGYLMTITSADEDNFVYNNVPGSNIIFALTDNSSEGTFKIDDGPENGTVVRVGIVNQPGQYNNWAPGEPNNWGSGEDYVVTKWNGSQWNDYGPEATSFPGGISGYVIEFGTWTNPDDQTFTQFYNSSVIHTNGETFRVQYNFNISNLEKNRFFARTHSFNNNVWTPYSQSYYSLNNVGRLDATSLTDTSKTQDGTKALISAGQVEFSYVNISNGITTLFIDISRFGSISPQSIKNISILDVYSGPVTYQQTSTYWAHYIVPSQLTKVTSLTSSFNSSIRNMGNNNWAFLSNISFSNNMVYKPQMIQFQSPPQDTINSWIDKIVTVSDVYLAFKEFSDGGGIFGGGNGTHMTSGIQFMNADVNGDNKFDESDCYKMLRHLLGQEPLLDQSNLSSFMKIIPKNDYDVVNPNNWKEYSNVTSDSYSNMTLSSTQLLNSFNLNIFWKGDVNMSHSPAQYINTSVNQTLSTSSFSIRNMSIQSNIPSSYIISNVTGDSLILSIKMDLKSNQISGTQFRINYDNSKVKYLKTDFMNVESSINFSTDKGNYINIGSLLTGGESLSQSFEYKLSFKLTKQIPNSLGIVSIASNEAVNSKGETIKIRVE